MGRPADPDLRRRRRARRDRDRARRVRRTRCAGRRSRRRPTRRSSRWSSSPVATVVAAPLVDVGGRATLDLDRDRIGAAGGRRRRAPVQPAQPDRARRSRTEELRALAALVDRYGARVIADELHAPLVYGRARHVPYTTVSDAAAEHTVTVTSASKAFNLAGSQVRADRHHEPRRRDAVAGPAPASGRRVRRRSGSPRPWRRTAPAGCGWPISARISTATAVDWPSCWPSTSPESSARCRRRRILAWLDCSTLGTDDPARFFLEQARVALSDGPPFGPGCDQYVRLNFATSRALLERIVGAMGDAVRPLRA